MDSNTTSGPLEANVDIDTFFRDNILGTQVVMAINFLFYGAYTILFPICLYILFHRRPLTSSSSSSHPRPRGPGVRASNFTHSSLSPWIFQLITTTLLFALATASAVLDALQAFADVVFRLSLVAGQGEGEVIVKLGELLRVRMSSIDKIFIIANAIADCLLIYRLYIIWGKSKRIIFLPTLISLGNTSFAFYLISQSKINFTLLSTTITSLPTPQAKVSAAIGSLEIQPLLVTVFLIVNMVSNVMVTGLIAGRIWWIRRSVNKLMGTSGPSPNAEMYKTALAIILESGLAYPIVLAITFAIQPLYRQVIICVIPNQVVGIAPTLILVRTGLGLSVEATDTGVATLDTFRCAPGPNAAGSGESGNTRSAHRVMFVGRRSSLSFISESEFSEIEAGGRRGLDEHREGRDGLGGEVKEVKSRVEEEEKERERDEEVRRMV